MKTSRALEWRPPDGWVQIRTIDAHTEGEPLRVILAGFPELEGSTILERRRTARASFDHLRTALMLEPRGHADMYGCVITPPASKDADFGVLFLHNAGWSTMCGHGVIAVTTVALETGLIEPTGVETLVRIDSPAGQIQAIAELNADRVEAVRFLNVPSFVVDLDAAVEVPGLGSIHYDLAFGGAFYAYVRADQVGLACVPEECGQLVRVGMRIKHAVMESRRIRHPFEEDLGFLYGTIFMAPPQSDGADVRNVCIFADGEVDRSPTGTGVSGLMAILSARGSIAVGERRTVESLMGTTFTGCIVEKTTFGPHAAVVPEVRGTAHITGMHTFVIDPEDPLRNGFRLGSGG